MRAKARFSELVRPRVASKLLPPDFACTLNSRPGRLRRPGRELRVPRIWAETTREQLGINSWPDQFRKRCLSPHLDALT